MLRDIILLNIHVYHKWRSYDIWFLKYKMPQTEIFVIFGHFLPLQPPDNPQNQNFKIKKKNIWKYYHFTHLHHKLQSYGSWDMERNRQKIKILKKWRKTPEDIIISQMCTINVSHKMYGSWDMECNGQNFCYFRPFFALLPP